MNFNIRTIPAPLLNMEIICQSSGKGRSTTPEAVFDQVVAAIRATFPTDGSQGTRLACYKKMRWLLVEIEEDGNPVGFRVAIFATAEQGATWANSMLGDKNFKSGKLDVFKTKLAARLGIEIRE